MHTCTPKLIVILGPTASGKTELSLQLARKFSGYIISADSRQIYKGMDIGTGKLLGGILKKDKIFGRILYFRDIPHFMIDIAAPDQEYSVAQYQKDVKRIIQKNDTLIPFLVGGTGLYISAIVDGLSFPHIPADEKLRLKLEKQSAEILFKKLKKLDPICSQKIDQHNKRRLIRALEVCLKTGKPFSKFQKKQKPKFDILQIGIKIDKTTLFKRIDKRVDEMIKRGLVEEVKTVLPLARGGWRGLKNNRNLPPPLTPPRAGGVIHDSLGYKQILQYLRDEITLPEAVELIKLRTRQYAKRQLTWFCRDKRIHWVKNKKQAEKLVREFLGR